jgi:2-dehydro-3-deoxyglucarate aldolase/4-hydroxy-2-oxoheptanedioate aldolase
MFDPHRSTLRQRFERGDTLGALWLSLGSVAIVELAARAAPDAIVLDLQHGLWDRAGMEHAIGIVPAEIPVLVRVAENSPNAIAQALDAGAEGIIVPLIESAEAATRAAISARYPPKGERSGGGIRPLAHFVDYVAAADKIVVCVMIETVKGVSQAADIAATPGVDLVFIGTGDLALSLGTFPNNDPRHEEACASILAACQARQMPCGIFTTSGEAAAARRAQGYRLVVTGNDIELVAQGFAQATKVFAGRA